MFIIDLYETVSNKIRIPSWTKLITFPIDNNENNNVDCIFRDAIIDCLMSVNKRQY